MKYVSNIWMLANTISLGTWLTGGATSLFMLTSIDNITYICIINIYYILLLYLISGIDIENLHRYKLSLPATFDGTFRLEILKKSLLRAIHDIDATFSKARSILC